MKKWPDIYGNHGYAYPGSQQPAWWGSTVTTGTANTVYWPQATTAVPPTPEVAPKPKSAVEWLRQRVDEVCALAPNGAAA